MSYRRTTKHTKILALERTARRLIADKTPQVEAVSELQRPCPDPVLLGAAAGRALARWEVLPLDNTLG
jgi:hypothetical protein